MADRNAPGAGAPWTPEQRRAWDAYQRAKESYEKKRQSRERAEDREQEAEMRALLARRAAKEAFGGALPMYEPEAVRHGWARARRLLVQAVVPPGPEVM